MADLWYTVNQLPDLTLNKYSSLEGNGVDGVIEKHIAFLRQLNRAGIVSGLSYHLFYLYLNPEDKQKDTPGQVEYFPSDSWRTGCNEKCTCVN